MMKLSKKLICIVVPLLSALSGHKDLLACPWHTLGMDGEPVKHYSFSPDGINNLPRWQVLNEDLLAGKKSVVVIDDSERKIAVGGGSTCVISRVKTLDQQGQRNYQRKFRCQDLKNKIVFDDLINCGPTQRIAEKIWDAPNAMGLTNFRLTLICSLSG